MKLDLRDRVQAVELAYEAGLVKPPARPDQQSATLDDFTKAVAHRLHSAASSTHHPGLLTDYKVLVLTVDEEYIAGPLQEQIVDSNKEINLDDATTVVAF